MRGSVVFGIVVGTVALAGCSFLAAAGAQAQENNLPPGPGREAVIAACSDCHGLVALAGKHLSYGAWDALVGDMMTNGASVPATDRQAIAGYLADNFGPKEAPADLPAAAK